MRPKKAKEFIPRVVEKTGEETSLVEDVVQFYWQEVRKSLSTLSHARIHLTNLGDFTIKHWKVDEKLEFLSKWKETNDQMGREKITQRFKTEENIKHLREVKSLIEEEQQRKEFIKLHKSKTHESES